MSHPLSRLIARGHTSWAFLLCGLLVAGAGTALTGGLKTKPASTKTPPLLAANAVLKPTSLETIRHPAGGSLVICGGGKLPGPIRDRFCTLAGGPDARIVVIPTATARADHADYLAHVLDDWRACGARSVDLLHTRSRETANTTDFVAPLAEATGVWLTGGDQSFLTRAYLGTAVQKQLKALLSRGGVIGGTSAGAAVMSGVMITGGQTKASVGEGFDFLAGAVIDQHFLKRNRVERLVGVLGSHPNLVGLGIDEQTALVVDVQEHHLSVIGDSYVVACVPDSQHNSVRLKFLKSGDQTALSDLKIPDVATTPVLGLGSL
jgi:cyanophycinase